MEPGIRDEILTGDLITGVWIKRGFPGFDVKRLESLTMERTKRE